MDHTDTAITVAIQQIGVLLGAVASLVLAQHFQSVYVEHRPEESWIYKAGAWVEARSQAVSEDRWRRALRKWWAEPDTSVELT